MLGLIAIDWIYDSKFENKAIEFIKKANPFIVKIINPPEDIEAIKKRILSIISVECENPTANLLKKMLESGIYDISVSFSSEKKYENVKSLLKKFETVRLIIKKPKLPKFHKEFSIIEVQTSHNVIKKGEIKDIYVKYDNFSREVSIKDPLYFQSRNMNGVKCSACRESICIFKDFVIPCQHVKYKICSLDINFEDLINHERFKYVINNECKLCKKFEVCGGCRGRSFVSGDIASKDPVCGVNI